MHTHEERVELREKGERLFFFFLLFLFSEREREREAKPQSKEERCGVGLSLFCVFGVGEGCLGFIILSELRN
jgi:hypothetical protein